MPEALIINIFPLFFCYQFYAFRHPAKRIYHFRMEDDAAQAGAALKHIVGDVPHLRGNLDLAHALLHDDGPYLHSPCIEVGLTLPLAESWPDDRKCARWGFLDVAIKSS